MVILFLLISIANMPGGFTEFVLVDDSRRLFFFVFVFFFWSICSRRHRGLSVHELISY